MNAQLGGMRIPFINSEFLIALGVNLLMVKPVAYFALISILKYRSTTQSPLIWKQIACASATRAVQGIVYIAAGMMPLLVLFPLSAGVLSLVVAAAFVVYTIAVRRYLWDKVLTKLGVHDSRLRREFVSHGLLTNFAFDLALVTTISNAAISVLICSTLAVIVAVCCLAGMRVDESRYRFWFGTNCPVCNYNLTGNVSGTCPECGQKVPPRSNQVVADSTSPKFDDEDGRENPRADSESGRE